MTELDPELEAFSKFVAALAPWLGELRQHPMRLQRFKRSAWMPLSLRASKPAGFTAHLG
jgi:hypothetical protein